MKHRTNERFWGCYKNLTAQVQKLADKKFQLLKQNPKHPSLHFKKIGKLWSARIGIAHRALAIKDNGDFIWVWIGTHNDYERIIERN